MRLEIEKEKEKEKRKIIIKKRKIITSSFSKKGEWMK
jgi:hypothetical protein